MTVDPPRPAALDPQRMRELFDLRGDVYASRGGAFGLDPYPAFHRLRDTGPVHEGIVGPLVGFHGEGFFQGLPYPDRPHFSVFDFAGCDAVLRDETYSTEWAALDGAESIDAGMLFMDGEPHRRYRVLVQPSFLAKRARWWTERWIQETVDALVDTIEGNGAADLNVEFCAPIPLLTICGSFGVSVAEALDIRAAVTSDGRGLATFVRLVAPIIAARREQPRDDLISVLVQAQITDGDGAHALSDRDILGFAFLLLAAGSGTTWKQLGITLLALLRHPEWLERVRADRGLLRPLIEESLRWMPTDPMFSRYTTRDVHLRGVDIPAGSVVHVCLAAANRDPSRWHLPDVFDPGRPLQSHLGFGSGSHVCLGMHVARAEIQCAVTTLLDRLPRLRLDPGAPTPDITGMYERGPTSVPVRFD